MIYFDNAASVKPRLEAVEAFNAVITENFANPAALHKGGIEAEKIITHAKAQITAHLPGAGKRGSLIFTSGATESNNLAVLYSVKNRRRTKIVTTTIEHSSVSNAVNKMCEAGYEAVRAAPEEDAVLGYNIALPVSNAVDENTALVSAIALCGETGFFANPTRVYDMVKACSPDCLVHTDAAQGFMRVPTHVGDLISISAHKIGGIPGIGALYVRDGVRINPMMFGGGQQAGIRPGTEPVALIAAFGAAAAAVTADGHYRDLYKRLISGLNILKLRINSRNSLTNIVNFSCGVKSEVMLHFLAERGIYVSSGSACARGKKSQILPYFGAAHRDIDTAIRVSFGWQNTAAEVDEFLTALETGIKILCK
jgi:cysteine desulfurase